MLELHSTVITDDEEKCFDRLLLLGNSLENTSYTDFLFLDYFYKVTLSGQLRLFKKEDGGGLPLACANGNADKQNFRISVLQLTLPLFKRIQKTLSPNTYTGAKNGIKINII